MSNNTVKGNRTLQSANSPYNAISFMMANLVRGMVNTADVVRVVSVDGGGSGAATGYVDVLPLVCQTDADNNTLQPATLYRLPYSRVQGGVAALVVDPVPGDIGIAIFTKRDSSNVQVGQEEPVQPGSFRIFDQADGFYIGGFLNQAPSIFLELDQEKRARLVAPESVRIETKACTIECQTFAVNASVSAGINAPTWSFNTYDGTGTANGTINGNLMQTGNYTQQGNFTQTGSITSTGNHTAGNISLQSHVHSGVERGNSTTNGPQ